MAEIDLNFEPCAEGDKGVDDQIRGAFERAEREERTTWITRDGIRIAAIVPLMVGRVMDVVGIPVSHVRVTGPTNVAPE
jgi:hypothetical protein